MRISVFVLTILALFAFTSCEDFEFCDKDKECEEEDYGTCSWDGSLVADESQWQEFVIEEVVIDESCGCPVSGVLKYVELEEDGDLGDEVYIVKYGDGECDDWGYLISYEEKKRKGKDCLFGDCDEDDDEEDEEEYEYDDYDCDDVCKFQVSCSNSTDPTRTVSVSK